MSLDPFDDVWRVARPEPPSPLTLDELVEWAERARGARVPPARIRVAPDLYEALRHEAHDRFTYTSASIGSSAYGVPIVVDYRLPAGEHRVDER